MADRRTGEGAPEIATAGSVTAGDQTHGSLLRFTVFLPPVIRRGRAEGAMATAAGGGNNTEGTIGGFKVVARRVYQLEDYEVTYSWESEWFIAH